MLAAFAEAARVLDRDDYREVAERNAAFLLDELRQESGRLLRTWKACPEPADGAGEAKLNGYLEDYAYLLEGLLELYQTTFDPRWFVAAQELAETMLEHFAVSEGTLYDTSDDHEPLITGKRQVAFSLAEAPHRLPGFCTRPRDLQDNATPSDSAIAATALLKLAGLTNDMRYIDIAHQALAQMQPMMSQYPLGFGQWLQALAYVLSKLREIANLGDLNSANTQALLTIVLDGYRPFQVVALGTPEPDGVAIPLLQNRGLVDGRATAYVRSSLGCQAPVTEAAVLRQLPAQQ